MPFQAPSCLGDANISHLRLRSNLLLGFEISAKI
jgi:hypothetical protein